MKKDRTAIILRKAPEPPVYLAGKILRFIEKEEQKRTYRRIAVWGTLFVVALGSAVAGIINLGAELSRSGFLSFASLFRTDFSYAMANANELFLSLAESFPAILAAFCLASIGFAVCFAARLIYEAGMVRRKNFAIPSFS
jgi:ABC-type antimicrobial peptide transport system permease subunit